MKTEKFAVCLQIGLVASNSCYVGPTAERRGLNSEPRAADLPRAKTQAQDQGLAQVCTLGVPKGALRTVCQNSGGGC